MTETSDDFPVPLRPTRPTLSSGPTMKDASRSRRPPTDLDGEVAARDHGSIASGW